jgi:hypothetical protein
LTVSSALANPQIVWLLLILTLLYSALAFHSLVVQFSQVMLKFQFPPQEQYLDNFIQQHALMIRGINREIGVEEANWMIRKVFECRFNQKQVVAVHTVRNTDNVQLLFHKRDLYRDKVE